MNQQLESDRVDRIAILRRALAMAENYYASQQMLPPGMLVPDIALDQLPEEGQGAQATLAFFDKTYADRITNSAGPRYFGFVTGGSTPAAVAGDWLVSAYDQNACGSNDSIAPQIERQTMRYIGQLLGFDEAYFGSFVTGATLSNFVGLALGRQWAGEQLGIDPSNEGLGSLSIKVASATPHSSIIKSLSMLGMGRAALQKIDTLPDREAIDIGRLENFLATQRTPVIVVANAGTVNTGDFDDLQALGDLKKRYNFWLHTDGAFGAFAGCSNKLNYLTNGINNSDSITVDAHKWLNVPYDAAMQFTRHRALQLKVFQNSAAYLGDPEKSPDFFHYTPENSRRWRALPSWFALRAYGKNGQREIVDRNCFLARQLGDRIAGADDFSLLSPVRLNIVCFTIKHSAVTPDLVRTFLNAVRDEGRVFFTPTVYKGIPAIRAAVSNWQTGPRDIEIAFESLCGIANEFKKKSMVNGR